MENTKVCVGGTFSPLHKGHQILLKKACEKAGTNGIVFVGIATGILIKHKKNVESFTIRKKNIQQFLTSIQYQGISNIQPITTPFGPTLDDDFDVIVVSSETKPTAETLNEQRIRKGKKPLQIVCIPLVLADDTKPLCSSRIKQGEINTNGHL